LKGQQFPLLLTKVLETGVIHKENEAVAYIDSNDGRNKYYLDFEYAPLFGQDKQVSGIMVTVNDVTERVEARKKIEETKERLRLAIEGSNMATWDLNLQTSGIIHSPRLAVIFGHAESHTLSHRELRSQIHPDDLPLIKKNFDEALQTTFYFYEARVIWPDKTIHWIRTRGSVLFDEQAAPLRMLGTVIDITESKEAEERKTAERKTAEEALENKVEERTKELKQANEELVRMNQELSSFAYVSSHDLQEPLRKIQTFATRIVDTEKDNLSEKGKDYLIRLENAATRMRHLIQDILAYSRANHTEKIIEEVDLNELLLDVQEELKESMLEKKAVLESDSLPSVNGIRFQLHQIFMNIISNAIKFAKQNEPVHISIKASLVKGEDIPDENADPSKTYHLLCISDNGIGFAQEFNKRIFEVFQRLHGKATYAGTGIGLAIVKKIVTNHGGIIQAFGKEGIGARFDIYLPSFKTVSRKPIQPSHSNK
jgi:PAS domain S-box-containing protein